MGYVWYYLTYQSDERLVYEYYVCSNKDGEKEPGLIDINRLTETYHASPAEDDGVRYDAEDRYVYAEKIAAKIFDDLDEGVIREKNQLAWG